MYFVKEYVLTAWDLYLEMFCKVYILTLVRTKTVKITFKLFELNLQIKFESLINNTKNNYGMIYVWKFGLRVKFYLIKFS